jgi:dynein heavy chain, axonemal
VEEAQLLLDDHSIKAAAMQSSPAAAPFQARIEAWVGKLRLMQDIFDAWLTAQAKWIFLAPVYSSDELAKQVWMAHGRKAQNLQHDGLMVLLLVVPAVS